MTSRRTVLGGALAATALLVAAAPLAQAGPKCSGTTATAVHTAETAVSSVPVAGKTAANVIHGGVEDAACLLP